MELGLVWGLVSVKVPGQVLDQVWVKVLGQVWEMELGLVWGLV